jgi:signal transduction histidine kinase/Tfp pilus assembly protein PilF
MRYIFIIFLYFSFCIIANQKLLSEPAPKNSTLEKRTHPTFIDTLSPSEESSILLEIDNLLRKKEFTKAAKLLDSLATLYSGSYKFHKAILMCKRIIEIEGKLTDRKLMGSVFNSTGLAYWRIGELDSALHFLSKGLYIRNELGDSLNMARSYNNIGVVYWKKGDIEAAYKSYLEALRIRERCGDMEGTVLSLNNIALIYQRLKYYDLATENIQKALKIADSLKYEAGKEYSFRRLGGLLIAQEKYPEAQKFCEQAIDYLTKKNDKNGLAQIYNDLGLIKEKLGEISVAKDYFKKSYTLAHSINDRFIESFALLNMGRDDFLQNDLKSALVSLEKGRSLAKNGAYTIILKDIYLQLSQVLKGMGQEKEALKYLNFHLSLKDSLINETMISSIGEMRIRFEIEKSRERQERLQSEVEAQNTINIFLIFSISLILLGFSGLIFFFIRQKKLGELLILKNVEMEQINIEMQENNAELIEVNETKNKLFSIIAHDLKNPFVSILGYSEIIKEEAEETHNAELVEMSGLILTSSQKLVDLVSNLASWSLLQKSSIEVKPISFDLDSVCDKVIKEALLNFELKKIEITKNLEHPSDVFADIEMISTVIRNFVSNAIKFTSKGGKVELIGYHSEKSYKLIIKDYGVGMSEEDINNILSGDEQKSNYGTDNEKGTGLGLTISREFINQNKGTLKINSTIGEGSEFVLELPIN